MIKFACTTCGQRLGVDDKHAGKRVKCTKCAAVNTVPAAVGAVPMAPPRRSGGKPASRAPAAPAMEPPPAPPANDFNPLADLSGLERGGDDGGRGAYDIAAPREAPPVAPPPTMTAPNRPIVIAPRQSAEPSALTNFLGGLSGLRGILTGVAIITCMAFGMYRGFKSNEAEKNFEEQIEKSQAEIRNNSDDMEVKVREAEKLADATDKVADTLTGSDKAEAKVVVEFLRYLSSSAKPYATAEKALTRAGLNNVVSLDTLEAISERLALVQAFDDATERYEKALNAYDQHMRHEIDKAGLSPERKERLGKIVLNQVDQDRSRQARDADRRLIASLRDALKMMQVQWGHWKLAPGGVVVFENDKDTVEFGRLANIAKQAIEDRARIRAEAKAAK